MNPNPSKEPDNGYLILADGPCESYVTTEEPLNLSFASKPDFGRRAMSKGCSRAATLVATMKRFLPPKNLPKNKKKRLISVTICI